MRSNVNRGALVINNPGGPGESRGLYVGTTAAGVVWLCYEDRAEHFAAMCAAFDRLAAKE